MLYYKRLALVSDKLVFKAVFLGHFLSRWVFGMWHCFLGTFYLYSTVVIAVHSPTGYVFRKSIMIDNLKVNWVQTWCSILTVDI